MRSPVTNYPPVAELLPHAAPMVLLDRVLWADGECLCAELTIGAASLFHDGDGVGAWVGIEYMAQAIAAHAGYLAHQRGEPVKVGFLLGTRRYEATSPLFADGCVLHVHARRELQGENGLGAYACRIEDSGCQPDGATLATAVITVFQPADVNEFLQQGSNGSTP